jgi:hypothetical protein
MSINWRTVRTAEDWTSLAEKLITEAREAIRAGEVRQMERTSERLLAFLQRRTTACPREVAEAVFQVQTELSQAVVEGVTGSIAGRTAQINAYLQDVQRVAQRLKEAAAMISLTKVRQTVDELTESVADLKGIHQKLRRQGSAALATEVAGVISKLKNSVDGLEAAQPD